MSCWTLFARWTLQSDGLTDDGDGEGAVGLVPRAVGPNVGDGFLPNGQQLGGVIHGLHLHRHLEEGENTYRNN